MTVFQNRYLKSNKIFNKMKKYFIIAFILLLAGCRNANDTNKEVVRMYHPCGSLHIKYTRINGMKEGRYVEFYPSGQIEREGFFFNDMMHGEAVSFHENGNVRIRSNWMWGLPQGRFHYYNKNGQLDSIAEFSLRLEETIFEYLERHTLTMEESKNVTVHTNSIIRFDNGAVDMDRSLFYDIGVEPLIENGIMTFHLFFSNPCIYFGYNCDNIEIITYVNSIADGKMVHRVISATGPFQHTTDSHNVGEGKHFFYAIIRLELTDGTYDFVLIRFPFVVDGNEIVFVGIPILPCSAEALKNLARTKAVPCSLY